MRAIAIIGGGKSWIRAPFTDPAWECWSHASCFEGMQAYGVRRWYDPHHPEVRAYPKSWSTRYARWLTDPVEGRTAPVHLLADAEFLGPVDARKPDAPRVTQAEIFNAVAIPRREMQAWFVAHGWTAQEYVTSTAAWMMRDALYAGATLIGLWGIDFEEEAEYAYQRPCMEALVAFARVIGAKVHVTPSSPLGRDDHIYGISGPHPLMRHTNRSFGRGKAQRMTVLQAMGKAPLHEIPAEIQALIDEEKQLFGMDTRAEWERLASQR